MSVGECLATAKRKGEARDGQLLYLFRDEQLTVYLGGRLLVQIKHGTVTAFQAHANREAKLINNILHVESLQDKYSMLTGSTPYLVTYNDKGRPLYVERPVDLLRRITICQKS